MEASASCMTESVLNEAKMEANQNPDSTSGTTDPLGYFIYLEVKNETEHIKRETEFEKIEIKKDPSSPQSEYSDTQEYFEIGESATSEPTKPETAISSQDIKANIIIEFDQELKPPENESEEHLVEVKQEGEDDELGVEEDPDPLEIKYSNTQDFLDIGETVISESSGAPGSFITGNLSSGHYDICVPAEQDGLVQNESLKKIENTWQRGRPPKRKQGRPKTSSKSRAEQRREANQRYKEAHPEVVRNAQKRSAAKHPEVNRRAVKRYTDKNPEVHRRAANRYNKNNPDVNRKASKLYYVRKKQKRLDTEKL